MVEFNTTLENSGSLRKIVVICAALVVIVLAVYLQTANHQFVFDDEDYVTSNLHVAGGLSGENILWAFTSSHSSNWHPVTWLHLNKKDQSPVSDETA